MNCLEDESIVPARRLQGMEERMVESQQRHLHLQTSLWRGAAHTTEKTPRAGESEEAARTRGGATGAFL